MQKESKYRIRLHKGDDSIQLVNLRTNFQHFNYRIYTYNVVIGMKEFQPFVRRSHLRTRRKFELSADKKCPHLFNLAVPNTPTFPCALIGLQFIRFGKFALPSNLYPCKPAFARYFSPPTENKFRAEVPEWI